MTVPLDLTADADRAIAPGVALARQLGAALELAVVTSPGLDPAADAYELQNRAAQIVGVSTSSLVIEADAALDGLLPLAEDPERLMCLASHGRRRLGEMMAPSLALSLVHGARRPAVVVGPRQDWWPGPVGVLYVGVDERGVAETTLQLVDAWAAALDAEVGFVQTQTPEHRDEIPTVGSLTLEDARAWMEERGRTVSVRRLIGEPAVTLADTADRAIRRSPLVVVTARVSTRRERVVHGSVTARLIAVNPVPTLVVPALVTSAEPRRAGELTVSER